MITTICLFRQFERPTLDGHYLTRQGKSNPCACRFCCIEWNENVAPYLCWNLSTIIAYSKSTLFPCAFNGRSTCLNSILYDVNQNLTHEVIVCPDNNI